MDPAPRRRSRWPASEAATLVLLVTASAGLTAGIDEVLLARVRAGTDNALRLAAELTYVGVDGSYTLARAMGITALILSYASVVLGLLAAERRSAGRPRWRLAGPVHRQLGLITLVLVAGHAAVPYTSVYSPYEGWKTALIPFGQPVSWGIKAATWESLGILAFYLAVLTGPTYYLIRRRSWWVAVHRITAVVYGLSVVHAFMLGTDFMVAGPARVALLAAQVPVLVLAARRVGRSQAAGRIRWAGTGVGAAGAGALVVLTILVATGRLAGGLRL